MAKTREKKVLVTEQISKQDAEAIFGEYASLDASIQRITSTMDEKITKIREQFQERLNSLQVEKMMRLERLQHFATTNPEFFTKKKSLEFTHGVIGFRTGNPTLKTLRGFTWASVTNLLKEFLPDYVRSVEEPAKDRLLADRDKEEVAKLLSKVGIQVVQSESFYVEPKKEEAVLV